MLLDCTLNKTKIIEKLIVNTTCTKSSDFELIILLSTLNNNTTKLNYIY